MQKAQNSICTRKRLDSSYQNCRYNDWKIINEKLLNIKDRKKYNIKRSKDFQDILNVKNAFGVYSTQLISSYLLKRNVYVIGHLKQKFDPFPLSRWGLLNRIYSTNDLKFALNKKYQFNNKFINSFKDSEKKLLNILLN